MITSIAIYAAIGVTVGALLLALYLEGTSKLRWYNVAFSTILWPVVVVGGIGVARRQLREDALRRGRRGFTDTEEWGRVIARMHELPWHLRMEVRLGMLFDRIYRWLIGI